MLLIFDLDGTLIDSAKDIAISVNEMRTHFGLEPLDAALIRSFVGNGAALLVERALDPQTPMDRRQEALDFFLKFYRVHALEHTELYPGVWDLLAGLQAAGHTLAVLTNKPERISADILAALELKNAFSHIYGGDSLPYKKPDPIGIKTLLRETGGATQHTMMIGDTSVDIETAHNAGVASCGVTWGFKPETLADSKPDFVIDTPLQLLSILRDRAA